MEAEVCGGVGDCRGINPSLYECQTRIEGKLDNYSTLKLPLEHYQRRTVITEIIELLV